MKDLDLFLHDLLNSVHGLKLYFENPSEGIADLAKHELLLMERLIKNEQSKKVTIGYALDLVQSFASSFPDVQITGHHSLCENLLVNISSHQFYRILKNILVNVEEANATYLDIVIDQLDGFININFLNDFVPREKLSNHLGLKSCEKQASEVGGAFSFGKNDVLAWSKLSLKIDQFQKKVA